MSKKSTFGEVWIGWRGWLAPNAACAVAILAMMGGLTAWNIRESGDHHADEARARLQIVADLIRQPPQVADGSIPPPHPDLNTGDQTPSTSKTESIESIAEAVGGGPHPITVDRVPTGAAPPAFAHGLVSMPVQHGSSGETVWLSTKRTHADVWAAATAPAAAASLALVLVAFASARTARGTAALRRVGSALSDLRKGDAAPESLRIADRFGPTAVSWNELLDRLIEDDQGSGLAFADRREGGGESGYIDPSTLDALPTGLLSIDDEGRVQFCNGAAAALLGLPRAEAISRSHDEFDLLGEVSGTIRDALNGAHARISCDVERPGGEGEGVIRATVRSLRQADEASALIMLEDVTQQRMSDAARNGFIAQATHELRTPLTNIRLSAEEAIDVGAEEPALVAKLLNVVNAEARRLERVVNDMLSVSEIEAATLSLNLDNVPLVRMFDEIERDYEAQAADLGTTLRFSVPSKFEPIRADRDKFALAIHNVIGNALKYTPPGGTVEVIAEQDEQEIRVLVRDNGPGIAPEDHEKIFQKFYRTETARGSTVAGSGLGLALAREVARLHGGDITLESEPGHGATFTVSVPRTQGEHLSLAA